MEGYIVLFMFSPVIFAVLLFFFHNISIIDGLILGLLTGVLVNYHLSLHPALSFLCGVGTALLIIFLFSGTTIGFWLISSLMSAGWAFFFSYLYSSEGSKDPLWTMAIGVVSFIFMMLLHFRNRPRPVPVQIVK